MSEAGVPKEVQRLLDAFETVAVRMGDIETTGDLARWKADRLAARDALEAAIERQLRANQGERERSNP